MRHLSRLLLAAATTTLLAVTSAPAGASWDRPIKRGTDTFTIPAKATITLTGHGYGHGRGMSQYGAQGAAMEGLSSQQIVSFYYPGTSLGAVSGRLRVLLTGDTTDDVVVRGRKRLFVRSVGSTKIALPTGPARFRLIAGGVNSTLVQTQRRRGWRTLHTLPGAAEFVARGVLRLETPSGTYGYRGPLRSAPSRGAFSSARDTVNVPTFEQYLRGVVPREIPASWSASAVQAQAIAARTYAAFERTEPGSYYDICDTTSCQVYGGVNFEHPLADEAIKATRGQVVSAGAAPAFTQFSASSGGWTAAGSMSYLKAQADPYDGWDGNPVHDWTRTLTDASFEAAYPTIGDLQQIVVTSRDGNGDWGGRIQQAKLIGSRGSVIASGDSLRLQFGLRSTWFTLSVTKR
ncbi:MAG: SpoIID/LytB domain-containing protein [Nocardioides sp.]|jgi:stage II sporulation protein D